MTDANADWVPKGEEAAPPYDPPPVDEEIIAEQHSDGDVLEGLENIPARDQIIAGLEEFREPFAQTRRREIAAELWPEYAGEIWSGTWETPSPDDVDPETGKVTDGVRWSGGAGCPVHVQASPQQERHIAEQALNDANTDVDAIVQRYEEILDDANYENSLLTAQRMRTAKQMLAAFSQNDDTDEGNFSELDHHETFSALDGLFETDWTGDEASRKGQKYFGGKVVKNGAARQWTLADTLLAKTVDDVRAQITLYAALGQMVYDAYVAMADKTHISIDIGVLQSLADALSTIGLFAGKFMPGAANAVGWASSMLTKAGDFVITVSWDQVAGSNDVEAWVSDLIKAADNADDEITSVRESLADVSAHVPTSVSIDYIPGEGYQDE